MADLVRLRVLGPNANEVCVGSTRLLFSYNTLVAVHREPSMPAVLDTLFSRTTSKHIKSWLNGLEQFKVEKLNEHDFKSKVALYLQWLY